MSSEPTKITQGILNYINTNFSVEDDFLKNLKKESVSFGMPDIYISPEQGAFLQFLIKANSSKNILEIGSLGGYSAITMANALPEDGKLIAVEHTARYCQFIERKVQQANLERIVEVVNKPGIDFLKEFDGLIKFDIIFVDADKNEYKDYFILSEKHLSDGGIFIADNALAFGQIVNEDLEQDEHDPKDIESIREFNQWVKSKEDYFSVLLPIGDGFLMSIKK